MDINSQKSHSLLIDWNRKTERQRDRETERQRDRDTEKEKNEMLTKWMKKRSNYETFTIKFSPWFGHCHE